MRTLVSLEGLSREEWLRARDGGLGSSDAAAVLGLSPWKSPLALWAEKRSLTEPDNLDEKEFVEWGIALEPIIAEKYHRITGRPIFKPAAIYQHDKYDWMIGNPDRFFEAEGRGRGVLEVKTTGQFHVKEWEEEAPLPYQVQLQHLLCVTGIEFGSIAVLIGGQRFRWMDVERNERFCSFLIEKEEAFWDLVQSDIPPMPDASDSTREVLLRLYPKDTGASKELPPEAAGWMERRRTWKEAEKSAQAELQEVENLIKAAVGEASIGLIGGAPVISWKHQHREPYTVAACDFRVLREVKTKGKK